MRQPLAPDRIEHAGQLVFARIRNFVQYETSQVGIQMFGSGDFLQPGRCNRPVPFYAEDG